MKFHNCLHTNPGLTLSLEEMKPFLEFCIKKLTLKKMAYDSVTGTTKDEGAQMVAVKNSILIMNHFTTKVGLRATLQICTSTVRQKYKL